MFCVFRLNVEEKKNRASRDGGFGGYSERPPMGRGERGSQVSQPCQTGSGYDLSIYSAVLRIPRIHMFLGLLVPDPLV
jgi:hypothetical protein